MDKFTKVIPIKFDVKEASLKEAERKIDNFTKQFQDGMSFDGLKEELETAFESKAMIAQVDELIAELEGLVKLIAELKSILESDKKLMSVVKKELIENAVITELKAFLDSDDLWYPSKLEQQLTLFEDSRVAIVYSNYEKIDEDGNGANRIVKAPSTVNYRKLLLGNVIGNLTGIYDTGKVGVIPFMDIHHEDYVLWLTILKMGYIAKNTSTTTAAYRILVSSVSSNKFRTMSWQWNIYRNIERIGFLQSCYYFANYAIRAYRKRTI